MKSHNDKYLVYGSNLVAVLFSVILVLLVIFVIKHTRHETPKIIDQTEPSCTCEMESQADPETPLGLTSENPRYGFNDEEVYLLAQLLCGDKDTDGDGEYDFDFHDPDNLNYFEISKVLCVVMNRQRDAQFPDTVHEVVLAQNPQQFVVFPNNLDAEPSALAFETVKEWCTAYDTYDVGIQTVPENHLYFRGNGVTNETRP